MVKVPSFRAWHATMPSGLRAKSRHNQYAQGFFADTARSLRDEKYRRDCCYTHVEIRRADYQHAAKAMPPEEVNERRPSLHTVIYNFEHTIISSCQSVSGRYLQQYVDEFTTRFNSDSRTVTCRITLSVFRTHAIKFVMPGFPSLYLVFQYRLN